MKLDVPYYSQFAEIDDQYWQSRACGMACLKMVLDYYGKKTPPLYEMVLAGKEGGGHTPSGWRHDYSLEVARTYGLFAAREEKMEVAPSLARFKDSLSRQQPVIVSVFRNFSEKDKFHQIVLTGFEGNDALTGFYCHDPDSPDSVSRKHLFVPLSLFAENWRKMAIFIAQNR